MHTWFLVLILALGTCSMRAGEDKPPRNPVPPSSKSAEKLKLIKEILADEYKDNTPDGRNKLLAALLTHAITLNDDLDAKYFLLVQARDLAIQLEKPDAALSACELIGSDYEIDTFAEKGQALTKITDASKAKDTHAAVAQAALKQIDSAIDTDQVGGIKVLAAAAERAALRSGDAALTTKVKEKNKAIDAAILEMAALDKARATLKTTPLDPVANLSVGKYHVFSKGNWDAGIQHFLLGSDAVLKDAAQKDQAAVDSASKVVAGDAWWAWSEKQTATIAARARERAVEHYVAALPDLTGLTKTKLEKRVASVTPSNPALAAPRSTAKSVVEIIKATYGNEAGTVDITQAMKDQLKNYPELPLIPNSVVGKELPAAGRKVMNLEYKRDGKLESVNVNENIPFFPQGTKWDKPAPFVAKAKLSIVAAYYGSTTKWVDVKSQVEAQVEGDVTAPIFVRLRQMGGDPLPGVIKYSFVFYIYNNKQYVSMGGGDSVRARLVENSPQQPIKLSATVGTPAKAYLVCDDWAELFIDGKRILGVDVENPGSAPCELKLGSTVALKVIDNGGNYGVGCLLQTVGGNTTGTTLAEWKTYVPENPNQWWIIPKGKEYAPAKVGTNRTCVTTINKIAVIDSKYEDIWPSSISSNATGYLFFIVTDASFKP